MPLHGIRTSGPALKIMHGPWNQARAAELNRCGHLKLFGRVKINGKTDPTFPISDLQHDEAKGTLHLYPHDRGGSNTVLSQVTDIMADGEIVLKVSASMDKFAYPVTRLQVYNDRVVLVAEVKTENI